MQSDRQTDQQTDTRQTALTCALLKGVATEREEKAWGGEKRVGRGRGSRVPERE